MKFEKCEVTPQGICPIAKFLMKTCGPKSSSVIHGPLGPIFNSIDKDNLIADYFKNQFRANALCD
jgi:hypothetical protein